MLFLVKKLNSIMILLIITICPTFAKTVELNVSAPNSSNPNSSNNVIATAEYYIGDTSKPTIVIIHGFMLTHHFPTVKQLAESLHESNFNVLTPSLSLGISHRKKTLACEAIHVHSLEQDVSEIKQWVQWLEKKSVKNIIIIGHSSGSMHIAHYLSEPTSDVIKQAIFIAIPQFNPKSRQRVTKQLKNKAQQLISENNTGIHEFKLAYCETYPSTAKGFLSYLQLNQKEISDHLKQINIPKSLIIGSKDSRVDHEWTEQQKHKGLQVITIKDANHFFDDEHEFDLFDSIETIIN